MKSLFSQSIALGVSILSILAFQFVPVQSTAQSCSEFVEQNDGNLNGVITVTNLPSQNDMNVIWTSSATDLWDGGPSYGVTYNTQLEEFSGRGWNEGLGVWIDFEYGNSDQARVLTPGGEPVGGYYWGYWDGIIRGLDNVTYSTQSGNFVTTTNNPSDFPRDYEHVSGTSQGDVHVGLGDLNFNNLSLDFSETEIPFECQEYVDLLANGATRVNLSSCDNSVGLVWNSNNVDSGTCSTVPNGAPWLNPGSRSEVNASPETSGLITTANTPSYFRIQCTGSISGNPVMGTARVSCEESGDDGPGGPGGPGGTSPFEFIES